MILPAEQMRSVTKRKGKTPMHEVIVAAGSEPSRTETRKRRASLASRIQSKRRKRNGGPIPVGEAKPSISEKGRGTLREEFLRSDPDADVQGPALVVCRLCGTKISFSSRETYGTGPWDRHIKRCRIEQADRSNLDPDTSITNASQEPDEELHPSIRISSRSTPLKLKTSMKGRRVADDPALSKQDIPQSEYGVPAFDAKELQTGSPGRQSGYRETPPGQSAVSYDHVTMPSGMQEEPATVFIASPSNANPDEVQGSFLSHDSEVTQLEQRWTDGAMITSSHEIIFRDEQDPCDVAARSGVGDTSAEGRDQSEAAVGATQLNDVALLQKRCEEDASDCPSLQKESSVEPKGEPPLLDLSQSGGGNELTSCTDTDTAGCLPSPALESDLDFEYPDWEPSSASGTFEHELLAAGISLENLIHHHGAVEIKFNACKELRVLQHA